jgi:hypothetical protein
MFHEVVEGETAAGDGEATAGGDEVTPSALLVSFEALVNESLAEAGRKRVVAETDVDAASLDAAAAGDVATLSVTDGAAILGVTADRDGETIVAELRDHLLIGMTTAVLDVDTIAAGIDADLTGQEVQQALEGRTEMTLGQLAQIMAVIERRKP